MFGGTVFSLWFSELINCQSTKKVAISSSLDKGVQILVKFLANEKKIGKLIINDLTRQATFLELNVSAFVPVT